VNHDHEWRDDPARSWLLTFGNVKRAKIARKAAELVLHDVPGASYHFVVCSCGTRALLWDAPGESYSVSAKEATA
jgi:hypothetical protein